MKNEKRYAETTLDFIQLICILNQLKNGPLTVDKIAFQLNITEEEVTKRCSLLQRCGFPLIFSDSQRSWRLVSDFGIPRVHFSCQELLGLLILYLRLERWEDDSFFKNQREALLKLVCSLSPKFMEMLAEEQERIGFVEHPVNSSETLPDLLDYFFSIISEKHVIRITYRSPKDPGLIETSLSPYHLFFSRSWYVLGYAGLYREVRLFKLSRIQKVEKTKRKYEIPKQFSRQSYFRNAWNLIPESGPDQKVVIRFSKKVARNVSEVKWHPTQEIQWLENGQVELRFLVSGLSEILWWILGYGMEAEVIYPEELRKLLREQIAKMQKVYEP